MHFLVLDRAPQPFDENIVHETTASVHRNRNAYASSLPVKATERTVKSHREIAVPMAAKRGRTAVA
jgi:hypothetical protein